MYLTPDKLFMLTKLFRMSYFFFKTKKKQKKPEPVFRAYKREGKMFMWEIQNKIKHYDYNVYLQIVVWLLWIVPILIRVWMNSHTHYS